MSPKFEILHGVCKLSKIAELIALHIDRHLGGTGGYDNHVLQMASIHLNNGTIQLPQLWRLDVCLIGR